MPGSFVLSVYPSMLGILKLNYRFVNERKGGRDSIIPYSFILTVVFSQWNIDNNIPADDDFYPLCSK